MTDLTFQFDNWIFAALILIISAGITAHIIHGYGSHKWKDTFIGLILLIMVVIQLYQLLIASMHVTTHPYVLKQELFRTTCLESTKGILIKSTNNYN